MIKTVVELVVHCFSEQIPDFARMLTAQLSSLFLWPPEECRVNVVICYTPSDELTASVIQEFAKTAEHSDGIVSIQPFPLNKPQLFRRGFARNIAAKGTKADVLWHIDADYVLHDGCLDALAEQYRRGFPWPLVFPREVNIHRSHALGDAEIARIVPGEIFQPDLSLFEKRQERFAIGGLQIVCGDTARQHGYCDGTKWCQPVDEAGGFRNTAEDKVYRGLMGGSKAIDLPGVYRMRHSRSQWETQEERLSQTAHKQ